MIESAQQSTVLGQSVKGVTYNVAVSATTMVLGFARSVLLMRYLGPNEFGYVSLALFFMVFLTHLSTLGLDSALVQQQSPRQETFSTHMTLRAVLALAVFLLALLLSPLLRLLYAGQTIVVDVLLVLSVANVLAASFATPNAILRRELRFGAIAVLNLSSSLAMSIGAPLMAYLGAGVWSLVFEQVVGTVVRWIGLWVIVRPWRPALGFDWGEAKSLVGFGRHVLLSQFLGITLDRFDDFWAGTALGATVLGYYSRAYEIAQYPARVLATPVTHVFFATYSALQDEREELSRAFSRSSGFLVRVGFALAAVLLAVIPEATLVLFGEVWLPIVPIFRLMTVYVVLDPLYSNLSYLVIGLGRPDVLARVRLLQVLLFVGAVLVGAHWWGAYGIALAADLVILIGVGALFSFGSRFLDLSLVRLVGWPIAALSISSAVGIGLAIALEDQSPWMAMIVKAIGVAVPFVAILGLTERRGIAEAIGWMRRVWGRQLPEERTGRER